MIELTLKDMDVYCSGTLVRVAKSLYSVRDFKVFFRKADITDSLSGKELNDLQSRYILAALDEGFNVSEEPA